MRRSLFAMTCWSLACSGADPGTGADLDLRIVGAQLERGALPAAEGGAAITFVDFRRTRIRPGEAGVPIAGRASGDAYAVNIGLEGDRGYWIRPVGSPDPAIAGELSWSAGLDFAATLGDRGVMLLVQAVDGSGRAGAIERVQVATTSTDPEPDLAIELEWDTDVDLDLYVTAPDGVTIGPKNLNTYEPPEPGERPSSSAAPEQGGMIDLDSNANCVLDGRRRETALFASSPPAGRYEVRVDLAALCEASLPAAFRVLVRKHGAEITRGEGALYEPDALDTAAAGGAAVFVLAFDLRAD